MKILIIGGTGLISTAITSFLLERGDDITLYNRGQTLSRVPPGYKTIKGNPKDFIAFEGQMTGAGTFDCVIDMVCFLPEEAESAIRAFAGKVGQYIFCSTVDVYTKPARRYPIREEAEQQPSPTFPYAFHKAACERLLLDVHQRGDLPVTIIRPAYTYGESRGILHSLGWDTTYLDRIRKGKPILVHGDGNSFWSACHINDVGQAFVEAAGNPTTYGQAYHVTGEEWLTWNAYHQGVAKAMDAPPPELVHIPTDLLGQALPEKAKWCVENFQYNNIFNNAAAHADLNFRYTISWIEGVRRAVAWLDAHNRIDNSDNQPLEDQIITAWQHYGAQMVQELK